MYFNFFLLCTAVLKKTEITTKRFTFITLNHIIGLYKTLHKFLFNLESLILKL